MPSSQTFLPATPLTSDLWASSSSSDEYTSDSDSPLKSLPAKPLSARPDRLDEFKWAKEPEHIDRTPRKLRKARECLRHSLICALALHSSWPPPRLEHGDVLRHSLFPRASHRGRSSVGEIPYPWADLADRIILLNGYADDPKISESPSFRACLRTYTLMSSANSTRCLCAPVFGARRPTGSISDVRQRRHQQIRSQSCACVSQAFPGAQREASGHGPSYR